MYALANHQDSQQSHEEIQRDDVAVGRPQKLTRENHERRPYVVVRNLSWELARYLDTEIFPADATSANTKLQRGAKNQRSSAMREARG